MLKTLEKDVKAAVFEYLELKGYHWWPTNNAGTYNKKTGFRRTPKWFKKGVPDANLILNGTYYAIELKSSTGKQSKEQKTFQVKMEREGGVYLLVRSINDLIEEGL